MPTPEFPRPDPAPDPADVAPPALPAPRRVVAFCQSPGSPLDPHMAALVARGIHVSIVPLRHLPLEWFDRYATSHDLALVDADFLGDRFAMIDFGMRLRRYSPGLPVIMLSARVAASDLSTERMAFCDVTLRLPATDTEMAAALSVALENHDHWRDCRDATRALRRA